MGRFRSCDVLRLVGAAVLLVYGSILSTGCHSIPGGEESEGEEGQSKTKDAKEKRGADKKVAGGKPDSANGVDVGFLLTMSYGEAKKLSPRSMELPPYYKVAADEITVVSEKPDGTPKKLRAKGHVFLQIDFSEEITALGQEALIGGSEVIIRGKPLLRRGRSVVEGLGDRTVFYVEGVRLQVIGLHRITNESGVTPAWRGSWKEGPNPLLPALEPGDIPKEMRASPLLPPVTKESLPKKRR